MKAVRRGGGGGGGGGNGIGPACTYSPLLSLLASKIVCFLIVQFLGFSIVHFNGLDLFFFVFENINLS